MRVYSEPILDGWLTELIGRKVVNAEFITNVECGGILTLDNGVKLKFLNDSSCCSWIDVESMTICDNIITAAELRDNEDETGEEGPYKAYLHVVTEAGEFDLVTGNGDASNGYYLHGFALNVEVVK